jgi:ankyrin repeat protein
MVTLLLVAGCSPSLRNNVGLTALELAEQLARHDAAKVLRDHTAAAGSRGSR